MATPIRPVLAFSIGIALGIGGTIFLWPVFSGAPSSPDGKSAESGSMPPPAPPKLASASTVSHLPASGQIADAAKLALPAASSDAFAEVIRGLLADGNSNRRLARFQLLLEKFSPDHFRALLPLIRENDLKGAGSPNEWTALWQYWGGAFPQDALAAMQSLDSSEWGPGAREEAQKRVMRGWAEQQPQEALAYFEGQALDFWSRQEGTLEAILKGWISTDPQSAAGWLGVKNSQSLLLYNVTLLYREAVESMARQGGTSVVEAWLAQSTAQLPVEILNNFSNVLAEQKLRLGLDAAKAWAEQHKNQLWMQKGIPLERIASQMAQKDPQATVEWTLANNLEYGMTIAMDSWCRQDAAAASQWLHDHPNTPFYDRAAYSLAMKLRGEDPEAAAAWAGTIKDEALKKEIQQTMPQANAR